MKRIILAGPQGSGKGTQAKLLEKEYDIPHISTGDIFREAIKNETELGKKAKEIIDAGNLVPDKITNGLVKARLQHDDCKQCFILDGYPRTIEQAKALDTFSEIDYVIVLDVPDEVSIKRISSRRICKNCGEIYGLHKPPQKENVCDKCSGELEQREDDKPSSVRKRLALYHTKTKPIIDHYLDKVHHVDGVLPVKEVFAEIESVLNS